MTVSIKTKAIAFVAAFACLSVACALAQQPAEPRQPSVPGQPSAVGQPNRQELPRTGMTTMPQAPMRVENPEVDKYFATCLWTQNKGEVDVSEFVLQRLQNPQVKQFAQQMITEHQAMLPKLQQLAGIQGVTESRTGTSPVARTDGQPYGNQQTSYTEQPQGATDRALNPANPGTTLTQIQSIQKAAFERAQENLKEVLQQKQGAELDQCYIGAAIGCHMQAVAELQALQDHTVGPLRQIAQESLPKVKQHLEAAEQIAKQLEMASSRQAGVDRSTPEGVQRVPR